MANEPGGMEERVFPVFPVFPLRKDRTPPPDPFHDHIFREMLENAHRGQIAELALGIARDISSLREKLLLLNMLHRVESVRTLGIDGKALSAEIGQLVRIARELDNGESDAPEGDEHG